MIEEKWIAIFLSESLTLSHLSVVPGEQIRQGASVYHARSPGVVSAFYDRLVDDKGRLVGIQIWPLADLWDRFAACLPSRKYLHVANDEHYFDVYFCRAHDGARSEGDQAFGGRLYVSELGEMALTVEIGYLLDAPFDADTLRGADVVWTDVTTVAPL